MRWMKNQPWNDDPTLVEEPGMVEWNLWTTRQPPFNQLDEGDQVFLACQPSATRSVITYEVEIDFVIKERYESKKQAWRYLVAAFPQLEDPPPMTERSFLRQEYTVRAPSEGWLLGWSYSPVRKIGVDRPHDLKFRPNGWRRMDDVSDAQLRRWGLL